jgi:ATPase subunit of ABC transporter with duplicated ATPase domains
LNAYKGTLLMVSHDLGFVTEMKWLQYIDLGQYI